MDMGQYSGDTFVERRQHPRLPVKLEVQYQALERGDSEKIRKSAAMDVSVTGMSLRSEQEMDANETVTLRLFVPLEGKREGLSMMTSCPKTDCRPVTILSRVVWCRPGEDQRFICGIEFLDVPLDDQDYLNRFLTDFRMPEPKTTAL